MEQKSVDAIAVETWSAGYHKESDSVILSFEFEGSDEPLALAMSRDLAAQIGLNLARLGGLEITPAQ